MLHAGTGVYIAAGSSQFKCLVFLSKQQVSRASACCTIPFVLSTKLEHCAVTSKLGTGPAVTAL